MEIVLFFVWLDGFLWYLVFAMQHARTKQINGTSLKGYVRTTFAKLVETFGSPCLNEGPCQFEKVNIEWCLRFSDGTIATIYNWKCYGWQPLNNEYDWHIGGHNSNAVELVKQELGLLQMA